MMEVCLWHLPASLSRFLLLVDFLPHVCLVLVVSLGKKSPKYNHFIWLASYICIIPAVLRNFRYLPTPPTSHFSLCKKLGLQTWLDIEYLNFFFFFKYRISGLISEQKKNRICWIAAWKLSFSDKSSRQSCWPLTSAGRFLTTLRVVVLWLKGFRGVLFITGHWHRTD